MCTIYDIKLKYGDNLHKFITGLMHDEIEAYVIMQLCFDYLETHISTLLTEHQIRVFLETGARKLCLNYLKQKYESEWMELGLQLSTLMGWAANREMKFSFCLTNFALQQTNISGKLRKMFLAASNTG